MCVCRGGPPGCQSIFSSPDPVGRGGWKKSPSGAQLQGQGSAPASEREGGALGRTDPLLSVCPARPGLTRLLAPRGRLSRSQQPHAVSSFNSNFYSRPSPPQQPRGARTPRTPTLSLPASVPHSPISGPGEARRWAPRAPPAAPGRYPSFIAPRRSVTQ